MKRDDLVKVYVAPSQVHYLSAVSVLNAEGIPYLVRNAGVQSLFGLGVTGTGFNPLTGPITLYVRREDVDRAREAIGV